MSIWQKLSLVVLLTAFLVVVLGHTPALNGRHWFLRVGVPELGLGLILVGLPAFLTLLKDYPRLSVALYGPNVLLLLWPWFQAYGISSELSVAWDKNFHYRRGGEPLLLAERGEHEKVTEEYREGLSWDRYKPLGRDAKARLLFVHGGSWRNGTREDYPALFEYLADRGFEVVSISYRLSGVAPYPAAVDDVTVALNKLSTEAMPLFLCGRSSGGHLALLTAYQNPDRVAGVIGFYPPVDMKWSYEHPSNPRVLDSQEAIVEFMLEKPEDNPQKYRQASPIHQLTKKGPPTLLIHGKSDCLVFHKQSEMLSEKLKEQEVPYHLLSIPWMEHGGDIFLHSPSGRLSAWAIEGFMDSPQVLQWKN